MEFIIYHIIFLLSYLSVWARIKYSFWVKYHTVLSKLLFDDRNTIYFCCVWGLVHRTYFLITELNSNQIEILQFFTLLRICLIGYIIVCLYAYFTNCQLSSFTLMGLSIYRHSDLDKLELFLSDFFLTAVIFSLFYRYILKPWIRKSMNLELMNNSEPNFCMICPICLLKIEPLSPCYPTHKESIHTHLDCTEKIYIVSGGRYV